MEIFMPHDRTLGALGVCSTPGCTGTQRGRRSGRSAPVNIYNSIGLYNETAGQICDAYIEHFLGTLQRTPAQRDVHYNGTIDSARDMCIFDVMATGVEVSYFYCRKHRTEDELTQSNEFCETRTERSVKVFRVEIVPPPSPPPPPPPQTCQKLNSDTAQT